jgi:dihydroxy-acid dehydratase
MLSGAMPMVFPTISIAESLPDLDVSAHPMAMDTEEMIRCTADGRRGRIADAIHLPAQIIRGQCRSADRRHSGGTDGGRASQGEAACWIARLWGKYRAGEIDDVEIEASTDARAIGWHLMVMGTARPWRALPRRSAFRCR